MNLRVLTVPEKLNNNLSSSSFSLTVLFAGCSAEFEITSLVAFPAIVMKFLKTLKGASCACASESVGVFTMYVSFSVTADS